MKKTRIAVLLVALFTLSITAFAQTQNQQATPNCCKNANPPMKFGFLPNLSQEQKDKINKLYTQHHQTVDPIKTQVDNKQKELNQLIISNADMSKKEAKVKEINELRLKLQIERVKYLSEIRNLLTDEQKKEFDSWLDKETHQYGYGYGYGRGHGCDCGKGQGCGYQHRHGQHKCQDK